MIIIFHYKNEVYKILDLETNSSISIVKTDIIKTMFLLSNLYTNRFIIWCNSGLENNLNINELKTIFHHKLIMASYSISDEVFNSKIGYVEQSVFINVKKDVSFSTWMMSTNVGGIHSSIINKFSNLQEITSFKIFLNVLAKQGISKGLICSSEPKLLFSFTEKKINLLEKISITELFAFVRKLYKKQWQYLLFFNFIVYEKKFPLLPFLRSFFINIRTQKELSFNDIKIESTRREINKYDFSVDVLIPTLGREKYLKDVLLDLNKQTLIPKKVIIIEQNPDINSASKLDYINHNWNFEIEHIFIHQLGACNARNLGLSKVRSNYVFFADDDIRFKNHLLEKSYNKFNQFQSDAIVLSCLQKEEQEENNFTSLATKFGTNSSIVNFNFVKKCSFKKEHEFGYGEDADFGMQLRNLGAEILSTPLIQMLHLKAPVGGFRYKPTLIWSNDRPKPSPTIMAHLLKNYTSQQLKGYKTILFLKFYRLQSIKNPVKYFFSIKKRWEVSNQWAKKLLNNEV